MGIPKYIHQIWYQSWNEFPSRYSDNVKSIIDHNPNWKHFKWDNESMREVIKNIGQEYLDKYDSLEYMHQRIDYGRYCVLYEFGGASIDCDAKSIKGLDSTPNLETSNFIVSRNSSNSIENYVKAGIPEVFINATILVTPKHPVLKKLIDHILELSCSLNQSKYDCIQSTTGPRTFTKYLLDNFKDKITILDNEYFDPCNGNDDHCELPDSAILDQQQQGSWANPAYKHVARVWYFIKRNWVLIIAIIAIIILIFSSKSSK